MLGVVVTEPCPRCPQKRPAERPRWNGPRRPHRRLSNRRGFSFVLRRLFDGGKKKTQPDFRSLRAAVSVSQKEKPRTRPGVEKRDDLKQFSKTLQRSHWISQCRISIKRHWTVRCKNCSISRYCLWMAENWNSFRTPSWACCTSSFIKHHEQIIWEVGSKIFSIRRFDFAALVCFNKQQDDRFYVQNWIIGVHKSKLASISISINKK